MTEDKKIKTIELIDDEDQTLKFDILATVEMADKKEYVIAMPYNKDEPEKDSDVEVVILEVTQENDDDIFVAVEDDDLLDEIFAKFQKEHPEFAD